MKYQAEHVATSHALSLQSSEVGRDHRARRWAVTIWTDQSRGRGIPTHDQHRVMAVSI